jgi:hypothetical protein
MKYIDFKGKRVVVTGASSGLGREIARVLALRYGADLVVAARRQDRLSALQREIESACTSRVLTIPVDLATPDGVRTLLREATATGEVHGLVCCAGVTYYGRSLEMPAEARQQVIGVNFLAAMDAITLFLEHFLLQGEGAILAVTSLAAFAPVPYQALYSAAKHGLQAFVESLAREYGSRGIRICTFVPGGIKTEMLTLSGLDRAIGDGGVLGMDPGRAARAAVRSLARGRSVTVPGFLNKIGALVFRILPRGLVSALLARAYKP